MSFSDSVNLRFITSRSALFAFPASDRIPLSGSLPFLLLLRWPSAQAGAGPAASGLPVCEPVSSPWPSFLATTPVIFLAWDREGLCFFPSLASQGSQRPALPFLAGPWSSMDQTLSGGRAWLLPWSSLLTPRPRNSSLDWGLGAAAEIFSSPHLFRSLQQVEPKRETDRPPN